MNEQQPYQKQLADKLQQAPLPDMEESWQQMKALLEEEERKKGAAFFLNKGKNFRGWLGILLVLLLAGAWPLTKFISGGKGKASFPDPAHTKQFETQKSSNEKDNPKNSEIKSRENALDSFVNHKNTTEQKSNADNLKIIDRKKEFISDKSIPSAVNGKKRERKINPDLIPPQKPGRYRQIGRKEKTFATTEIQNNRLAESYADSSISLKKRIKSEQSPEAVTVSAYPETMDDSVQSPAALFGDSVHQRQVTAAIANSSAGLKKEKQADQSKELIFSAGLSLSQNLAIDGQRPFSYNNNAKRNLLTDYIPAIFLQYHFAKNSYVQVLFRFNAPQYTKPLLLYQYRISDTLSGSYYQNSQYIRKLYYYHVPLTVYFSPAKHFWIGAGLQYAHLKSALIQQEEKQGISGVYDSLLSSSVSRLEDDSLGIEHPVKKSEWRGLVEVNYYWNRWTLGLSYNQAFSDFININLSGTTRDKNKSLQLYLRYNIWELRRKKKPDYLPNIFSR